MPRPRLESRKPNSHCLLIYLLSGVLSRSLPLQVSGMIHFAQAVKGHSDLSRLMIKQMAEALDSAQPQTFTEAMFKLAALLISSTGLAVPSFLIPLLCQSGNKESKSNIPRAARRLSSNAELRVMPSICK